LQNAAGSISHVCRVFFTHASSAEKHMQKPAPGKALALTPLSNNPYL
jgi:hypothetical protein